MQIVYWSWNYVGFCKTVKLDMLPMRGSLGSTFDFHVPHRQVSSAHPCFFVLGISPPWTNGKENAISRHYRKIHIWHHIIDHSHSSSIDLEAESHLDIHTTSAQAFLPSLTTIRSLFLGLVDECSLVVMILKCVCSSYTLNTIIF